MNKFVTKKLLLVAAPVAVVVIVSTSLIANAVISGQSTNDFGNTSNNPQPSYSMLANSSPTPSSVDSNPTPTDAQAPTVGNGSNGQRSGQQNSVANPFGTEAGRACQAMMEQMAAESVRLGALSNSTSQAYTTLLNELQATYGSNPWSAEDTARYEQLRAETERVSAEVTAFWAQYPWNQWGCNENGLWHVP